MFSLDDETLEAGGESILASKGDLGQLLFSASAGLADLSRSLSDLRTEADGFYKYRARSGELSDLKGRLAALKEERERIDTLASHYVAARRDPRSDGLTVRGGDRQARPDPVADGRDSTPSECVAAFGGVTKCPRAPRAARRPP